MTVLAQNRQIKSVKLIFVGKFWTCFVKKHNFLTNNRTNFIKHDSNILLFKTASSVIMCKIGPSAVKVRFSLTSSPPEGIEDLLGRISATFPSISPPCRMKW